MRYQTSTLVAQRSTPLIVDEDEGIPSHLVEDYHRRSESGPPGPAADPRSQYLSSMSEFDKTQNYDVYEYQQPPRPDPNAPQDYTTFAGTHTPYAHDFVGTQAQVSTNLVHTSSLPFLATGQPFQGTHDPTQYYSATQTHFPAALPPAPQHPTTAATVNTSAFLQTGARQLPEVLSLTPGSGSSGVKISILIQTQYDLQTYPQTIISVMFGHKRCDSVVSRVSPGPPHQYVVQTTAPPTTGPLQVAVALAFEGPVSWQAPTLDVGTFTYTNSYNTAYPLESPPASRKRKLSLETERLSPTKKQSSQDLNRSQTFYPAESSIARPQAFAMTRRVSQPGYSYDLGLPRQHYYAAQPASARLPGEASTGYDYYAGNLPKDTTVVPAARSAQLLPSPASSNPPLIRTSTLHHSPPLPGIPPPPQGFNPYAMYPANTKAMLKIDGDLNSMVEQWTDVEMDAKRRLVQFQRSQQGSIITTTFEPVTLEERAPNSICVSCIWWQEKQECYVTSVDTIQLLESLVAVRFTVEEKNRIRRNLEGFRPATVSKTKADSEDFFKLIMGFPNPKPRNIEKDVKVFPWRILSTALKKIIGKYSASYSSTAGALHTPSSSYASRLVDSGIDQRTLASPRSTSSSVTSHGHTYATAMTSQSYLPHAAAATVDLSAGPPTGLRLTMPQATSWHAAPASHYGSAHTDLSTATGSTARTPSWDYASGLTGYGMTAAMPVSAAQYHTYPASSMLGSAPAQRWVPLQDYEHQGQPTTSGA